MTDSYEIMSSVFEWLNIIEMKKFVEDGMLLQMKITLIICQNKNTSTTRTSGGFISNKQGSNTIPLRNRSDFKKALSTLERLQQEAVEEPYVPTYSHKHKQWQLAQSSSSTWWNWQDSWWSSYNSESQGRSKQNLGKERRGDPLFIVLWREPQKMAFKNSIYFVTDGSFTADSGLL